MTPAKNPAPAPGPGAGQHQLGKALGLPPDVKLAKATRDAFDSLPAPGRQQVLHAVSKGEGDQDARVLAAVGHVAHVCGIHGKPKPEGKKTGPKGKGGPALYDNG